MSVEVTVNVGRDGDEISGVGELLELLTARPAWHADAACREPHPDADWYAESSGHPMNAAVAVCRACLVVEECRWWALTHPERFGVWGGLNARQRALLRRKLHLDDGQLGGGRV